MEKNNEVYGEGNAYDFGARMLDVRLGRWFAIDPSANKYPDISPYCAFINNPICYKDSDGKDAIYTVDEKTKTITISSTIYIIGQDATKEKAKDMQSEIMKVWGKSNFTYTDQKGDEYKVKFDISVETPDGKTLNDAKAGDNIVQLGQRDANVNPSYVQKRDVGVLSGRFGKWDVDPTERTWAHETGHLLGFADRYVYVDYGNLGSGFEDLDNTDPNEIMVTSGPKAKVTQKDIDAIAGFILTQNNSSGTIKASDVSFNEATETEKKIIENHGGTITEDPRPH